VNDLRSFYKGKRVFITGHTGFKGAWLSLFLIELGAEVIGYSLDPKTEKDLFVEARIDEILTDIRGDIRNKDYLESKLIEHQPEIIFHLAAQPLVIESYINPLETWEINVMGTLNLLEALKKLDSVKSVVVVTTDKVYKSTENNEGYSEDDPLGGHDPYSSSKAAVELAVESWRDSFFANNESPVGIATARAGNVIGGGDWAENRLVPDYFRAHFANQVFDLRNPNSIRPWQHVLDVLHGYLTLGIELSLNPLDYSSAWNFGPENINHQRTIEVINKFDKHFIQDPVNSMGELNYTETINLKLISSKSNSLLKWRNIISFERMCDLTKEYYYNQKIENPRKLVEKQIDEFLKSLSKDKAEL
jgi:CDP-glucose 4,6-dehydratase